MISDHKISKLLSKAPPRIRGPLTRAAELNGRLFYARRGALKQNRRGLLRGGFLNFAKKQKSYETCLLTNLVMSNMLT